MRELDPDDVAVEWDAACLAVSADEGFACCRFVAHDALCVEGGRTPLAAQKLPS